MFNDTQTSVATWAGITLTLDVAQHSGLITLRDDAGNKTKYDGYTIDEAVHSFVAEYHPQAYSRATKGGL